jgi:Uma2 family endonuclease
MTASDIVNPVIDQTLSLLPLESGDRLSRDQFERRYMAMPEIKKAELIEGIVYMASKVRLMGHGQPHAIITGWLGFYRAYTSGLLAGNQCTVRLDQDNEVQPDCLLMIENGGQAIVDSDDYVAGAPELIVEVAASSASIDMHDKLAVYLRNRVPEYLVWRVYEKAFDWFRLQNDAYAQMPVDEAGVIRSEVFPGLWLAKDALLSGDFARVLAVLQQGLATSEHQAFVARLAQAEQSDQSD